MKIPLNLILPNKRLQERLEEKLTLLLRPFLYSMIPILVFVIIGNQINSVVMERWKNPDQYNLDGITGIVFFALAGSFILMLCHPKETTKLVLFGRSIISIFVCYMIVIRFDGKKMCTEPVALQIKFFKSIFLTR